MWAPKNLSDAEFQPLFFKRPDDDFDPCLKALRKHFLSRDSSRLVPRVREPRLAGDQNTKTMELHRFGTNNFQRPYCAFFSPSFRGRKLKRINYKILNTGISLRGELRGKKTHVPNRLGM